MSSHRVRRITVVGVGLVATAVLGSAAATADNGGRSHHEPRPAATTAPVPATPGVPDALRISTGPYAGFQQCGTQHLIVDTRSGLLAASPAPGASGGSPLDPYPGLVGTYEIALPGQEPFHRHSETIWPSGYTFAYQVPQDMLPDGEYRWRIRAEDGTAVSDWSVWCSFTVRVG
jgi:hypothetical protein